MREIHLTGNRGKGMIALVDDEDYEEISKYSWNLNGWNYAYSGTYRNGIKESFLMHRIIMKNQLAIKSGQIDHINGNKLDNRKENLRIVTQSENQRNRGSTKNSISKYKGVSLNKSNGKWVANIKVEHKNKNLGQFNSEDDAAYAYNLACVELHGEFAKLNVLPEGYVYSHIERVYTSHYRGVYYVKRSGKWRSRIIVNKEEIVLGFFDSEEKAALAYNVAASKYFGDKAKLNIIGVNLKNA